MKIGLRIDVDTFRGTRYGVPSLCRLLSERGIRATFFFSVGPDNMGRNIWRLSRPRFLAKMLRSRSPSLYGWDVLLRGTILPGPVIASRLGYCLKMAAGDGHEMGFHAWDHYEWQTRMEKMSLNRVRESLERGVELMSGVLGSLPVCSAAPAWKCNEMVLSEKERFPFKYNSDCRGNSIFMPVAGCAVLKQPQIPVSMPTYDEVIGRGGVNDDNYNDFVLAGIRPEALNVLTVHAEVEGIARLGIFERFLTRARDAGHKFYPLGEMLEGNASIPKGRIRWGTVPGRDGGVAVQDVA